MAMVKRPPHGLRCVLLAAGGSSRLGSHKQLVRWRGRTLLRRAADAASAVAGEPVVVVLGADALRLRAMLARSHAGRVAIVHHAGWRTGLASSLRRGLGALPPTTRAVLFMLADQPLVDAGSLARLVSAWRRRPSHPAAACYRGRLGVPAILPRRAFTALRAIEGDAGARRMLAASEFVTAVDMPEAAIDVDTREDVERLAVRASSLAPRSRAYARPHSRPRAPARRSRN